jgi:TRAP-type mannitol/chloroaromatic compound transport system permease small subunit
LIVINLLTRVIDAISATIARWASLLILLLIMTLTYEVVVRYGFNAPTQWSYDATYFISSLFLILGMAYTWQQDGHVSVDLISSKIPRRVNAGLQAFLMIVLFFFCWFNIFRVMIPHLQSSWLLKERSMTGFMPPVYPYKTWIFFGVALLVLQGVVQFIKEMKVVFKAGGADEH